MFNVGQQLYNLTSRDMQTSFLDPFFRTQTGTAAITQNNAAVNFTLPIDRSLYIHSVVFLCQAEAATDWISVQVAVGQSGGSVGVFRQSTNSVLADEFQATYFMDLILPPGINTLQLQANRTGTTGAANSIMTVNGYLIPAGGINRLI